VPVRYQDGRTGTVSARVFVNDVGSAAASPATAAPNPTLAEARP
jgi:hypothetical protein